MSPRKRHETNEDYLLFVESPLIHYSLQRVVNYVKRVIPSRIYNCKWLLGITEKLKAAAGGRRFVTIDKINALLSSAGKQEASHLYEGQTFVTAFGICH